MTSSMCLSSNISYTVNAEDLFQPQNVKLAPRPLELIIPLWGYFSHSWDKTIPIGNRNSPQWDPIWPFGAGPTPVNGLLWP